MVGGGGAVVHGTALFCKAESGTCAGASVGDSAMTGAGRTRFPVRAKPDRMSSMLIETKTIRLRLDDRFTSQLVDFEGGSVWIAQGAGVPPLALFNFALSEKTDFFEELGSSLPEGEHEGDDQADRYRAAVIAYFDMKAEGAIAWEDSTVDIGGRLAFVRTSEMVMPQYGEETVFRLFVNVPLDDEFCQEFSAVCRPSQREEFEPLFWQAIHSAEFLEGRVEAIRIQEEARADMYARVDAAIEKAEELSARVSPGAPPLAEEAAPTFEPFAPPSDGSSLFRLGDFQLQFVEEETSVGTTSFTHQFGFTLVGRVVDPTAASKGRLTSEYNEAGEIQFPIYFSGGYGTGNGPEARLEFEEDKCQSPYINASIKGTEYGLRFSGLVEITDGWVSVRGRLACSYDSEQPAFDVEVRRPFAAGDIDWTQYTFASLAEVESAPPEVVRFAAFKNADLDEIPDSLLRCKQLERLSIPSRGGGGAAPLAVPSALCELTQLTHLDLSGRQLDSLPECVGDLHQLETLNLSDCGLSQLPDEIWRLPRLQYLFLSENRLATVPENVELPALYSLDVQDSLLRTIPASLAAQPKLRTLKLTGNPLDSVPDVFNDCAAALELPIEDKRRLLDYEYRGADGRGTGTWDEDAFYIRSDSARARAASDWLAASELAPHADALQFLLKRSVGLAEAGEEDYGVVGGHRFGGMPDLPPTIPYPRFSGDNTPLAYEFIGQLNCEELAPLQDYLPRTGMLYFFLSTMHDLYGGDSSRAARVLYFDGSVTALGSGKDLHLAKDEYYEMTEDAYPALKVVAAPLTSAPEFYAARQNPHLFRGPAAQLREAVEEIDGLREYEGFDDLSVGGPFGFEVNAYAFTQHEDPEHQVSLHQKGVPEDWTVLLKVGSRGGFMWGDAGDLSYVIHKSDLAKGDFSNVHCTLESS